MPLKPIKLKAYLYAKRVLGHRWPEAEPLS